MSEVNDSTPNAQSIEDFGGSDNLYKEFYDNLAYTDAFDKGTINGALDKFPRADDLLLGLEDNRTSGQLEDFSTLQVGVRDQNRVESIEHAILPSDEKTNMHASQIEALNQLIKGAWKNEDNDQFKNLERNHR